MPKKSAVPAEGSDEWKAFVADAAAKDPSKRTEAEREALHMAFPNEAREVPRDGSEEWTTFVADAAAKEPS
jgi:hypothetical protein